MNLTDLSNIIQNLKEHGFTSAVEKLLGVVLVVLNDEAQPCELIEVLELGKKHCQNSLNSLAEAGLLEKTGKRDIFYRPTRLLVQPQDPRGSHQDSHGSHQDSHGSHQDSHGSHQDSYGSRQDSHGSHQDSSISPVNMLTVNLTEPNLTNKQEIENSEFSQAKVNADSGENITLQSSTRHPDKPSRAKKKPTADVTTNASSAATGAGTGGDVRPSSDAGFLASPAQSPASLPPNVGANAPRS